MFGWFFILLGAWWFWAALAALSPVFFLIITAPYGLWKGRQRSAPAERAGRFKPYRRIPRSGSLDENGIPYL